MKKRPLFPLISGYRLAAVLLSLSLAFTSFYTHALTVGAVSDGASSSSQTSSESSSDSSSGTSDSTETNGTDQNTTSDGTETEDSNSSVDTGFTVNSAAVYLVNLDSGTVIYEKNADVLMYPASLAKIMTCLLAIENCDDLTGTTTTASYTVFDNLWGMNASNAGLYPGEELRMIDLLYALMLRSGCDAAGIIAEAIGGSEEAFVQMMNDKAEELGCTNTHFTNSSGLHDANQYTTAIDMYRITMYAMQYDIFKEISTSYSYDMPATNKNDQRTITHTCTIMNPSSSYYDENVHAIKTGTTDESGRNLVSYASKDAYNYLLITMGAPIYYADGTEIEQNLCYQDTLNFYDWAFNDWAFQTIVKTTDVKGQAKVALCSSKDVVNAVPENDVNRLMLKSIDSSSLQMIANLPTEPIDAPITKGDYLGTLEIRMEDRTIATVNLVAEESLKKSAWLSFCRGVANFFTSPGFWLTILTLIIAFVAWVFIMRQININRQRRRRAARKMGNNRPNSSRNYSPPRSGNNIRKSSNYRGPSTSSGRKPQQKRPAPRSSAAARTNNRPANNSRPASRRPQNNKRS